MYVRVVTSECAAESLTDHAVMCAALALWLSGFVVELASVDRLVDKQVKDMMWV